MSAIEYIKVLRRAGRSGDVRCGGELCLRWFVSTNESQGNARDLAGRLSRGSRGHVSGLGPCSKAHHRRLPFATIYCGSLIPGV